ncbi:MAG TPA: hypothetical protein VMK42_07325 [Anaeromyxobacteraceae bacterium]|nr:hypothetical protein [Anaeromyxobacteraceae bacterium]
MKIATVLGIIVGLTTLAAGCGGSSGYSSNGSGGGSQTCSGGTPAALTVLNYLGWCSVSVAGGAPSGSASITECVADGSVALAATALTGFELGSAPWHDTAGDHGSGDPGTVTGTGQSAKSSTTVSASGAAACAWVCCPFTNGTGCPTTDQCQTQTMGY